MPRIFFATDLHGSEMCWRKFLNAAKFYEAEVLICGGDMTGKADCPDRRGGWALHALDGGPDPDGRAR